MFRYSEDRRPLAMIAALTLLDVCMYLLVDNVIVLGAYAAAMIVPKGIVSAWNHHHQHVPVFRARPLNRALELVFGLHTGMPTNMWVLHHVLGHHLNYLDQSKDESRWRRTDGSVMGKFEYTMVTALTAYSRAVTVGRRHPKALRPFLVYGALTWGTALLLTWARPLPGLMLFLLPMVMTLIFTSWVTADHHMGLESDSHFEASRNIMNPWFNRLTGNLGYHTAHHYRQGVHWSRLPSLHAQISDRIPEHCYMKSTFDVWLPAQGIVDE